SARRSASRGSTTPATRARSRSSRTGKTSAALRKSSTLDPSADFRESVVTPVERSTARVDWPKVDLNQAASLQAPSSEVDDAVPLEQYRLAFERNPQPMWVYDLDSLRLIAV